MSYSNMLIHAARRDPLLSSSSSWVWLSLSLSLSLSLPLSLSLSLSEWSHGWFFSCERTIRIVEWALARAAYARVRWARPHIYTTLAAVRKSEWEKEGEREQEKLCEYRAKEIEKEEEKERNVERVALMLAAVAGDRYYHRFERAPPPPPPPPLLPSSPTPAHAVGPCPPRASLPPTQPSRRGARVHARCRVAQKSSVYSRRSYCARDATCDSPQGVDNARYRQVG